LFFILASFPGFLLFLENFEDTLNENSSYIIIFYPLGT